MVVTRGLTHVAVAVRDVQRTADFYQRVLGAVQVYRGDNLVQLQTPGAWDVLVFEENAEQAGKSGGVLHFGFRLMQADDIDRAAADVVAAGGTVIEKGEFCAGEPYLFAKDPDGYTIEIWYELPTSMDPSEE